MMAFRTHRPIADPRSNGTPKSSIEIPVQKGIDKYAKDIYTTPLLQNNCGQVLIKPLIPVNYHGMGSIFYCNTALDITDRKNRIPVSVDMDQVFRAFGLLPIYRSAQHTSDIPS